VILQDLAEQLFNRFGHDSMYDLARRLRKARHAAWAERASTPMSDFYSGLVYRKLGIPRDLFSRRSSRIARVGGLAGPLEGAARWPIGFNRPTPDLIPAVPAESLVCPWIPEMPRVAVNLHAPDPIRPVDAVVMMNRAQSP